ncbi:MAG: M20/M25/M40 family metallo-hydrolase [Ruthenibacterium sp.]
MLSQKYVYFDGGAPLLSFWRAVCYDKIKHFHDDKEKGVFGLMGWIMLGIVCIVAAALCVGTMRATAQRTRKKAAEQSVQLAPAAVDGEKAARHLAQLVRIPTVSNTEESLVDDAQFAAFRAKLTELYPALHAACPPLLCGKTGLLFHWKGKSAAAPTVLMAHYDVVPADEGAWQHPPFCGEVFDGALWGRGTLDTKITLLGALEAAEQLLSEGFTPENDVYFAFGGDEEVAGHGATDLIAHLKQSGITPALVVDEGGAVVQNVIPGIKKPVAVVGIGEKGQMSIRLTLKGDGGHASHPRTPSLLGRMSKAVIACEKHAFPGHITAPVKGLFTAVAPHAPFALRVVFDNMWCFGGLLCALGQKLGSELNAMLRTTVAFTTAKASPQFNVMPTQVSVGVNIRSLNTDTVDSVRARLAKTIRDKDIALTFESASEASPYARTEGAGWEKLSRAVSATWPEAIVAPYLMIAASDSRHYAGYCDDTYRFSAMALSAEQRGLIHNNDERIPVADIERTVQFYRYLEQQL